MRKFLHSILQSMFALVIFEEILSVVWGADIYEVFMQNLVFLIDDLLSSLSVYTCIVKFGEVFRYIQFSRVTIDDRYALRCNTIARRIFT